MTTRPVSGPSDSDLLLEAAGGRSTSLVLSARSLTPRSASVNSHEDVVWVARRSTDDSVWSAGAENTDSSPSSAGGSGFAFATPSSSWINQYGAAAHYAFYAHILARPNYSSFSAYA